MKLIICIICLSCGLAAAAPPDGQPYRVTGSIFSGSGIGVNGEANIVWADAFDCYYLTIGPIEVYLWPTATATEWDVEIYAAGDDWSSTISTASGWEFAPVSNGLESNDVLFFAFLVKELDYGIGSQWHPTIDYVYAGICSALIMYFCFSVLGEVLRNIGILKRI